MLPPVMTNKNRKRVYSHKCVTRSWLILTNTPVSHTILSNPARGPRMRSSIKNLEPSIRIVISPTTISNKASKPLSLSLGKFHTYLKARPSARTHSTPLSRTELATAVVAPVSLAYASRRCISVSWSISPRSHSSSPANMALPCLYGSWYTGSGRAGSPCARDLISASLGLVGGGLGGSVGVSIHSPPLFPFRRSVLSVLWMMSSVLALSYTGRPPAWYEPFRRGWLRRAGAVWLRRCQRCWWYGMLPL